MTYTIPRGDILAGDINKIIDDDIHVSGRIDEGSRVTLISRTGSITVDGKIDGHSTVSLTAARDVTIGGAGTSDAFKIDGNSHVEVNAGGRILVGNKIGGQHTSVDFRARAGIHVGDNIDSGATARLAVLTGSIEVSGGIADGDTSITCWPPNSLQATNGIGDNVSVTFQQWAPDAAFVVGDDPVDGHWWQNWPQTYGYVTQRYLPRSLGELRKTILEAEKDGRGIRAVGGGWSFTDASLPFTSQTDVDRVSTAFKGAQRTENLSHALRSINDTTGSAVDLLPQHLGLEVAASTAYDQSATRQITRSGGDVPGAKGYGIIDTRGLASSLQDRLPSILTSIAAGNIRGGAHYFHVEAGITMADLNQLLDHQRPRLAIQASGGSPGATLAGTLATATHGGEFRWPLLVDRVKAVHLVGPRGQQWWIEGRDPIADPAALGAAYQDLDSNHILAAGSRRLPGFEPQDVLNAVIVSMGSFGVVYSVVLEVVPQFGLQQIVVAGAWDGVLSRVNVTAEQLRNADPDSNLAVLNFILDGQVNGTGIALSDPVDQQRNNIYADLAINPVTHECWTTNRRQLPDLPTDPNSPPMGFDSYLRGLSPALARNAPDNVGGNFFVGRLLDFLDWGTDGVNITAHVLEQAPGLLQILSRSADPIGTALALFNVQAVANAKYQRDQPHRAAPFVGDLLTGFLNALQDTIAGPADRTDISYKVGAIGWPDGGMPGRGLEIGLHPTKAFTFLQADILDDILRSGEGVLGSSPLLGYISIRICPPTNTFLGMQQFAPYSVMIEIVGYRSPETSQLMDRIQQRVLQRNIQDDLRATLHWGLETQFMTAADLLHTPYNQSWLPDYPVTRLDAFRTIRTHLRDGSSTGFDNNFTTRLGL